MKSGKAAVTISLLAGAAVGATLYFSSRAKGWLLYQFLRPFPRGLSAPGALEEAIQKDRATGPVPMPAKFRGKLTCSEEDRAGTRVFRAVARGGSSSPLRLIYLHGCAYVISMQAFQWNVVAGLMERLKAEAFVPDYPLGPEAGSSETLQAVLDFYTLIADEHGAENIVLAGDSAGGGLAILLAQALRDRGLRQPRALVCFSPWLDLSGSGPDQPALARRDPMLTMELGHHAAEMWIRDIPANDPRVSPLFGRQGGVAPTIIFSGDRDLLDSDALRFKAQNPSVTHSRYPGMFHVWVAFPLPESRQALDEASNFVRRTSRHGS